MKTKYFFTLLSLLALSTMAQTAGNGVPRVAIDTYNRQAITSKDTYILSTMVWTDENGTATYDSLSIRGRGNSTWDMAKKPYKLKFLKKEKMLGKGYANTKKWVLLANHGDKTMIRNALTSLMGGRAGLPFNPAACFVDLTLNGSYVGLYQFTDQVDVRPHRVNIAEQDVPLTAASDISGGYLLEADGSRDFHTGSYWSAEQQRTLTADGFITPTAAVPIRIHYPDGEDLEQRQADYIRDYVRQFERRLYAANFDDPSEGYRPLVDSTTLVNWYLCTEMSGNVDGFYSAYFYKQQGDPRLYWGPLWDYDIAYNNDSRTDRFEGNSDTSRQLMKDASYGNLKQWVNRLWLDPWFATLVNRRYQELLDDGMEDYLNRQVDSLTTVLSAAITHNYQRWSISSRTLRERVLYSTYDQYVSDLRQYIHTHLAYLSEAFRQLMPGTPYVEPELGRPDFTPDTTYFYTISNGATATCADIDPATGNVCANARSTAAMTQQWRITTLQNGFHHIVNRATGQALNDPTPGQPGAVTMSNTQLNTAPADSADTRQQWDIVGQQNNQYNLVNRYTKLAANLRGGSPDDNTPMLSYTSDERNATSANRLWRLMKAGNVATAIREHTTPAADYALAYNTDEQRLHFGSDDLSALSFTVSIYDCRGRLVRQFKAAEGTAMNDLPQGLYLVSWKYGGRHHTVKLNK